MTGILTEKRRKLVEAVVSDEDLLWDILLHLTAEFLFKFKCVSKHWCSLTSSLISDPKFCTNHTRMNRVTSMLGVYYYFQRGETSENVKSLSLCKADKNLSTLPFLNHAYNSEPVIVHTSKGLSLCSLGDKKPFVIFNMTTQKCNQLPQHNRLSSFYHQDVHCVYLDYDPLKSLHYKVVLVGWFDVKGNFLYYGDDDREEDYSERTGTCFEIDIYSSESKAWKRKHFPLQGFFGFECGALWNGAIHWMTRRNFHVPFELVTDGCIESDFCRV